MHHLSRPPPPQMFLLNKRLSVTCNSKKSSGPRVTLQVKDLHNLMWKNSCLHALGTHHGGHRFRPWSFPQKALYNCLQNDHLINIIALLSQDSTWQTERKLVVFVPWSCIVPFILRDWNPNPKIHGVKQVASKTMGLVSKCSCQKSTWRSCGGGCSCWFIYSFFSRRLMPHLYQQ